MNEKECIESKAILVKGIIEDEFRGMNEESLERFFDDFKNDKRVISFIKYYNKSVLDKNKINFGEFKHRWAIQGMTKDVIEFFEKNQDKLKEEIITKKDIKSFFRKYCTQKRREWVFCSKLFHTFLPDMFPPVDNPIMNNFNLKKENLIDRILIVKRAYELFIKNNVDFIKMIRRVLSKNKFSYLRVNELSDIRLLDMYYWVKKSRNKETKNPLRPLSDFV